MYGLSADRFQFFTGNIGIIFLIVLTAYTTISKEKDDPVTCWTPAHFMPAHVAYANAICEYEESRVPFNNGTGASRADPHHQHQASTNPFTQLFLQTTLVYLSFFILSTITTSLRHNARSFRTNINKSKENTKCSGLDEELMNSVSSSCTGLGLYLLVKLLVAAAWIMFTIKTITEFSSLSMTKDLANGNHTFLCEFDIKALGRIQRYTVQCVEDEEETWSTCGLMVSNMVLSGSMLVMILVHLVNLILCTSRPAGELNLMKDADKPEEAKLQDGVPTICCYSDTVLLSTVDQ